LETKGKKGVKVVKYQGDVVAPDLDNKGKGFRDLEGEPRKHDLAMRFLASLEKEGGKRTRQQSLDSKHSGEGELEGG